MSKRNYQLKSPPAPAGETPSTAVSIFDPSNVNPDFEKLQRRNRPQSVKPGDLPVGAIVDGKVLDTVEVPSKKAGEKPMILLWMQHPGGTEFCFPYTGVIRNALGPDPEKLIGKNVRFIKQANGVSTQYKRPMFMFDVFCD